MAKIIKHNLATAAPQKPARRLALLDVGTNAIRLAVYEIQTEDQPRLYFQARAVTRLGAGAGPELRQDSINRTLQAARSMLDEVRSHGAVDIRAVATAAVRESPQRRIFQKLFQKHTKCPLQVISGHAEARLVYMGLAPTLPADSPVLIMDIGGGSTELIVGTRQRCLACCSLPIGAVRLTEEFPALRAHGPVPQAVLRTLLWTIHDRATATLNRFRRYHPVLGVGTSGTTRSLAALTFSGSRYAPAAPHIAVLPRTAPPLLFWRLARLEMPLRAALPGMEADRADIIIAGAAITTIIMQSLRLRCLRITAGGLREGLLHQFLADCSLRQQSGHHMISMASHGKLE
ncbi:MAG: Ppx/GppA phosphatase family protein [Kiritimatiellia bacterium]|nr:hypothetical protein [Lentisphaerota bacterium]